MMTVTQLSRHGGIPPHVVRYYTRIGLLDPARDPNNGYKLYRHADIERLRFIRLAQRLGYTLDEIHHFLQLHVDGKVPCQEVREILRRRIDENHRRIRELVQLQWRMEQALSLWEDMPAQAPGCESVSYLIECASQIAEA
jgi:MerR family transcriptional regulator, Zn(II)-responsive regulator of zntA